MNDEFICCKECGNKAQHCTCEKRRVSDSSQPAGWVACASRLPELGDYHVLVCFDDGETEVVNVNVEFGKNRGEGITHWMPLPQPPNA